jgi:argininosuccinate lyase
MENKIWKGRIEKNTDKSVESFTCSLDIDKKLYIYDLMGTAAHVICLNKIGIVSDGEIKKIFEGLKEIKMNLDKGIIDQSKYEDIHSLIEDELVNIVGSIAEKIHTGRSRNDQIVLDEKMFVKDALLNLLSEVLTLQKHIIKNAEDKIDIVIPAYTHMQKAQPVLLSHYLMSFFNKFNRDIDRLIMNFENSDYLPMGAAACTGSGYDLDRKMLKELLVFKNLETNSMDVVGSRDFLIDFIFSCTMIMLHLSRFSEDLVIYNSQEFSFIEIYEDFCTGSSIMPQKKNPDVLELVRGKSSLVIGNLVQFLILLKGLPSTYNRDLQEDKKILFDAYEETISSIKIFSKLIDKIKFNIEKTMAALKEGFIEATDMADYLVAKGESFRKSHEIVGKMVRFCIDKNMTFSDLSLKELKMFSSYFENDIYEKMNIETCISSKKTDCGTGKSYVISNIKDGKKKLDSYDKNVRDLAGRTTRFEKIVKFINE